MSEYLANSNVKSISELLVDLNLYKYNPTNIQRVILDYLEEITEGNIDVVDPSNPFVFLLESSAVNTAMVMLENKKTIEKNYLTLSETYEDLHNHMGHEDYNNIFSKPSSCEFTVMIQYSTLLLNVVSVENTDYKMVVLPRNTEVSVDETTYSLQYPIEIRVHTNGVVSVVVDTEIESPLKKNNTDIIQAQLVKDNTNEYWLYMSIDMDQFKISTTYLTPTPSDYFVKDIKFTDQFYCARVYVNKNNSWVEINVIHWSEIHNPNELTVLINVGENSLTLTIPLTYLLNDLIEDQIRIDIYTTKGHHITDFSNYNVGLFEYNLKTIDTNDINVYSNAMTAVSFIIFSNTTSVGGRNRIGFLELKKRLINDSLNTKELPLTITQLGNHTSVDGFDLNNHIDVITGRIILATRSLPEPTNTKLLTSGNITVSTLGSTGQDLLTATGVFNNGDNFTITPQALFNSNNGIITLIDVNKMSEILAITNTTDLVEKINSGIYLYTPFHYVLGFKENNYIAKAYHLTQPKVTGLNFKKYNHTTKVQVNIQQYEIKYAKTCYRLKLTTCSDSLFKNLDKNNLGCQISFTNQKNGNVVFITGTQTVDEETEEYIYEFVLNTTFNISYKDQLELNDVVDINGNVVSAIVNLTFSINIYFYTTSIPVGYVNGVMDSEINSNLITGSPLGITKEILELKIGEELPGLWTNTKDTTSGLIYEKYETDVYKKYLKDEYVTDSETGSIFSVDCFCGVKYTKLHSAGDLVLDEDGNKFVEFKQGDVRLDEYGAPILSTEENITKHTDMCFIDASYKFTTYEIYELYQTEMAEVISGWVLNEIAEVNKLTLEKTNVLFSPKKTIGAIRVLDQKGDYVNISADQSFIVDLHVSKLVVENTTLKEQLETLTIKTIEQVLTNRKVTMSDIMSELHSAYRDSVEGVSVSKLHSDTIDGITLINDNDSLSVKKKLITQENNKIIVTEDITINFITY